MNTVPPVLLPNGIPLPALAPLSEPLIAQLVHQFIGSRSVVDALRRFPQGLGWLLQAIGPRREQVARDLDRIVRTDGLTVSQFIELLRATSPPTARPTVQLLSPWRGRGILEPRRHGFLEAQRAAAVLLARSLVPTATRNWLPDEIAPREPIWWCWRQDGPTSPITICPVPLPPDLPPSALLWVPWAGAAWLPNWSPIATGALYGGRIRTLQALVEAAQIWHLSFDAGARTDLEASDDPNATELAAQQFWIRLVSPIVLARFAPIVASAT